MGGGGNANGLCTANDVLFANAEAACKSMKLDITGFSPDDRCGASSSDSFSYTCCP
jgi:hypothetical protein